MGPINEPASQRAAPDFPEPEWACEAPPEYPDFAETDTSTMADPPRAEPPSAGPGAPEDLEPPDDWLSESLRDADALVPPELAAEYCPKAPSAENASAEVRFEEDGPPDVVRRERLRELAARLWIDAPRARAASNPHLICTLAGEDFALPLANVLEVQRLPAVTAVPHLPDWLMGVTNRRGDVLSVVDLAGFLGLLAAPSPTRRLVVVGASRDGLTTGLVVDRVCGIRGVPPEAVSPPTAAVPYVRGACEHAGRSAAVLDLDGLLLSPRMRRPGLD